MARCLAGRFAEQHAFFAVEAVDVACSVETPAELVTVSARLVATMILTHFVQGATDSAGEYGHSVCFTPGFS
jgi:hypothetical protein